MASKKNPSFLSLVVKNREGTLFEGEVRSITSFNDKGKFDILPTHSNFITLVSQILKITQKEGNIREIPVDNGVLKVTENKAEVYLGIK